MSNIENQPITSPGSTIAAPGYADSQLSPAGAELEAGKEILRVGCDPDRFLADDDYAMAANAALIKDAVDASKWADVYTELHKVGDRFVLLPETIDAEMHWAIDGGYHSMFDSTDGIPAEPAAQHIYKLARALGIGTDTIVAKGRTILDNEAHAVFTTPMSSFYRRDGDAYDWTKDLASFSQRSNFFDIKMRVDEKTPPEIFTGPEKQISTNIYPKFLQLDGQHPSGIISGFVSELGEGSNLNNNVQRRGGKLSEHYAAYFKGFEANSARHQEVYAAAEMERPYRFNINIDGYDLRLACDYTLDEAGNYANVAISYDNPDETDTRFETARAVMTAAVQTRLGNFVSQIRVNEIIYKGEDMKHSLTMVKGYRHP